MNVLILAAMIAHGAASSRGVQIVWQQPQPQPYYYLVYRKPAAAQFPVRVKPDFLTFHRRWTDPTAKPGSTYRYRVCSVYSPDGSSIGPCTPWFRS